MYLVVLILPLIGSIIAGMLGRKVGEKGSVLITSSLLGVCSIWSIYGLFEIGVCKNNVNVELSNWIESGLWLSKIGLKVDSLTVVMLCLVSIVSTLVHMYSSEYMLNDGSRSRFMSYLSLFTFFMYVLVMSDNYIGLFMGYEGVGLCSYLLISFWYTRLAANKAAIQAMLVNRVGDIGLALGIIGIYMEFRSLSYDVVFTMSSMVSSNVIFWLGTLIFIGGIGKSAQIGLHMWLPNAMEGPTPVSALIHAATMVTAGVFVLVRSSALIEYNEDILFIITIVGGMTCIFAATTGLVQNDLKKVIAYSTASQLGYMMFACGLSCYTVGVFHLFNHGFFKALLFLSAGSIIHGVSDEQDIRRIGGLVRILPFTYSMIFIGSFALMGFPFLTGFYSKDVILEMAYVKGLTSFSGKWVFTLGCIGAFCTAFYSIRLMQLVFLVKTTSNKRVIEDSHESNWRMRLPLFILSIGSIWLGYVMKDMFIGPGTDFWRTAIFIHPENQITIDGEFISSWIKLIPLVMSGGGLMCAWLLYSSKDKELYNFKMSGVGMRLYKFLNRKWYFDKVVTEWVVVKALDIGYRITFKSIDKGILEMVGPLGLGKIFYSLGVGVSKTQSGYVYNYIIVMLIGLCFGYALFYV